MKNRLTSSNRKPKKNEEKILIGIKVNKIMMIFDYIKIFVFTSNTD